MVLILGAILVPGIAAARGAPADYTTCLGVVHFPAEPVDDAPSKAIAGIALPPMYAGGEFMVGIDGSSGPQSGVGIVGDDGLAFADVGLFQYGPHEVVGASLTFDGTPMLIDQPR